MNPILLQIADELAVRPAQVGTAIELLDGGATVPFIARYRKEATGGLDDVQLRELDARLAYLRELADRRTAVLKSIDEQGRLTAELRAAIAAAPTKQELEDLYLPYKQKRRSKATMAREAGLAPLADRLFADPALLPIDEASAFAAAHPGGSAALAEAGFADTSALLDGVRDILAERWAEDAALVGTLRQWLWEDGRLQSRLRDGKNADDPEVARFRDYFDYAEPIGRVPSHRALAVFRGRALEFLDVKLVVCDDGPAPPASASAARTAPRAAQPVPVSSSAAGPVISPAEGRIAVHLGWRPAGRAGDALIRRCIGWAWKVKLSLSLERDLFNRLREDAEKVAIKVFAANLRDLLLAAPAGPRVVMGLDPGIRTGCKVAVVDATGKVLAVDTVYPLEPKRDWDGSLHALSRLCAAHGVTLIAIGNGTGGRETDRLAGELIKRLQAASPSEVRRLDKVVVSEAGASVYSASEYASRDLPELDVSLRGAVSIARRLQDPLAELVKIEPKSIGVGQYQHDLNQGELARSLDAVVEDCVNAVGVDLNTASQPLLARVSGLSGAVAGGIVRWRDANGAFRNRRQLLDVAGLGAKTFEQSAGFLRIRGGDDPLDQTGVHPETYPVVHRILAALNKPAAEVMGRSDVIRMLMTRHRPEAFADDRFGAITVGDILAELEKPARDPRPDFKVARLADDVEDIKDLKPGMTLEGTVSNVAQFGAFVDLGVHQDGLIHVSQLAHKFVADAREVVKTGDIVKVKVLEVDLPRKRISLTMKLDAKPAADPAGGGRGDNACRPPARGEPPNGRGRHDAAQPPSAMAAALSKLPLRR